MTSHGHEHGPGPDSDRRYLLTALTLLAAFQLEAAAHAGHEPGTH